VRYALHEVETKSKQDIIEHIINSRHLGPNEKISRDSNVSFIEHPWNLEFTVHSSSKCSDQVDNNNSNPNLSNKQSKSKNVNSIDEFIPCQEVTITIIPNPRADFNQFDSELSRALVDSKAYFLSICVNNVRKKETIVRRIPVVLQHSKEYKKLLNDECNNLQVNSKYQEFTVTFNVPGFIGTYRVELRNYWVFRHSSHLHVPFQTNFNRKYSLSSCLTLLMIYK
jgi:hypothetical protein